ncbi:MAG: cytochrome c oxidase assembly protein [Ardenticatenia bacterium]|nr:cytochrome c oxidase assembly protein [Ardenticatenia bacterium]
MQVYNPPWTIWLTEWTFEPSVVIGLVGLVAIYFGGSRYLQRRSDVPLSLSPLQRLSFVGAVVLMAVALLSPINGLGERYSFTVHMVQHLILIIPVPIFLLVGTPEWLFMPLVRWRPVDQFLRWLTHPLVVFFLFNFTFLGWHLPALYELSLTNEIAHVLEHLSFLGAGVLSWWPIMGPRYGLSTAFLKIAYLFAQKVPTAVLGAILTFAETPFYRGYAEQPVRLWGMDPLVDQQVGGVIMWIPASLAYLAVLTVIFVRWMGEEGESEQQGSFA